MSDRYTYNNADLNYSRQLGPRINSIADQLGVRADFVAGFIQKEINDFSSKPLHEYYGRSLAELGMSSGTSVFNVAAWPFVAIEAPAFYNGGMLSSYQSYGTKENDDQARQSGFGRQVFKYVTETAYSEWGAGSIKIGAALDAIQYYIGEHGKDAAHAADLEKYLADPRSLAADFANWQGDATIKVVAIMARQFDGLVERWADKGYWSSLSVDQKGAAFITFMTLGPKNSFDTINSVGEGHWQPAGGLNENTGGPGFIRNATAIREALASENHIDGWTYDANSETWYRDVTTKASSVATLNGRVIRTEAEMKRIEADDHTADALTEERDNRLQRLGEYGRIILERQGAQGDQLAPPANLGKNWPYGAPQKLGITANSGAGAPPTNNQKATLTREQFRGGELAATDAAPPQQGALASPMYGPAEPPSLYAQTASPLVPDSMPVQVRPAVQSAGYNPGSLGLGVDAEYGGRNDWSAYGTIGSNGSILGGAIDSIGNVFSGSATVTPPPPPPAPAPDPIASGGSGDDGSWWDGVTSGIELMGFECAGYVVKQTVTKGAANDNAPIEQTREAAA